MLTPGVRRRHNNNACRYYRIALLSSHDQVIQVLRDGEDLRARTFTQAAAGNPASGYAETVDAGRGNQSE